AAKGALLRTRWEMDRSSMGTGFYPEPIPTSLVTAPKFGASFAAAGYTAQKGRVRLGKLGCINCHDGSDAVDQAVTTRTGPLLGEIGRRADPHWLERWILDPHAIRPETLMPDVMGDSEKDKADAEAIVHFLVAPHYDAASWTQSVATEPDVLDRGRELYHTVGCIQCHGALESPLAVFHEEGQSSTVPSPKVPLPHGKVAGKWHPAELARFLKDPQKIRPSGAMPSLLLSDEEADLIATYLISSWKEDGKVPEHQPFQVDPAKVDIGRAAFAARGCGSCHSMGENLPDVRSTLKVPALAALGGAALTRGCLDPADTSTPRYKLSDAHLAQLRAAIEPTLKATGLKAPVDHLIRTVDAMDCRVCHTVEGQGGVQSSLRPYLRTLIEIDLGDEGRLPPHLNLAGWKLTTPWLREVFTQGGRARRYMTTRMPQFGEVNIGRLPEEFAHVAGVWPDEAKVEPKTSDEILLAGRQLVGDGGLNCITCHAVGDYPPAGAPGPNVAEFAGRLRYEWWHTYALGPARQKPGTRMPAFFATGKSTKTDIYGGDPQKQIDALWAYFNLGGMAPPPSGVQTGKGLALSVGDRPRVFRTFMKDAGSRGIAVGFPVGTHFGFDATAVRLVDAWKGDFIDASGAWANRGGNPASGQGQVFWTAPPGPALIIAAQTPDAWPKENSLDTTPRFRGYRLTHDGVPTFQYSLGEASIEETFTPVNGGLRRAFVVAGVPAGMKVFFNAGPGVAEVTGQAPAGDPKSPVLEFPAPATGEKLSFSVLIQP
ncbi:MAG: hypothetical protein L6Q35_15615, partial [Phycisphaerales bacterium]|nr:hypothetical protein [Phycisphaerales bacterium]